jgi:hypothetical protein
MPHTVQDLHSPSGLFATAGIAHPFRGRWLPRRSVHAAFECDPSCPDLPGLPPTPASFRPTFTRSAECYLVRPRVRQTSAQWPVSLQGSSDVSSRTGARDSSSPAGTANRAHPRSAPSTSERSSSRVPDPFPGVATGSWVLTLVGLFPSRAFLRLKPRALTDLPGESRSGGPGAHSRCATHGVAPCASGRPFRRACSFETARRFDLSAAQTLRRLRRAASRRPSTPPSTLSPGSRPSPGPRGFGAPVQRPPRSHP